MARHQRGINVGAQMRSHGGRLAGTSRDTGGLRSIAMQSPVLFDKLDICQSEAEQRRAQCAGRIELVVMAGECRPRLRQHRSYQAPLVAKTEVDGEQRDVRFARDGGKADAVVTMLHKQPGRHR